MLSLTSVWLDEQLGRTEYAHHLADAPTGEVAVFYFRRIQHAVRFLSAFPELELAEDPAWQAGPSALVRDRRVG